MASELKTGECSPPELIPYPAPAKLNLFLHVVGRRADGYHLLQSVFRFIDLSDRVWLGVRDDGKIVRLSDLPGVPEEEDLTVRAARLLQARTGCKLGADIRLEKRLPMGGGLGGGSSDAATVLLALNRLWEVGLTRAALQELALQLGADVPVFVFGESAFAEGVGEKLTPIKLPPAWYVVLTPPVGVATKAVFASPELTRNTPPIKISDFLAGAGRNDLGDRIARNGGDGRAGGAGADAPRRLIPGDGRRSGLGEHAPQIAAVVVLGVALGDQPLQIGCADEPLPEGDLLGRGDAGELETLLGHAPRSFLVVLVGPRPAAFPASAELEKRAFNGVTIGKGHLAEAKAAGLPVGICVTPMLPLEDEEAFVGRLVAFRPDVLVVQDFHDACGGFGADTGAAARRLLAKRAWNSADFARVRDRLQKQMLIFEGEAGFFPPPAKADHLPTLVQAESP